MSEVTLQNLCVDLGGTTILEDVSLSASGGELVGLVGPNGAGKTTLLRTISGAVEPSGGTVTVQGQDVTTLSSRASSQLVAVVPQETTLSFAFPVRDVVGMGRYPHRSRFSPPDARDRTLIDQALERTDTAQFEDRIIESLSGGERQRVLIARAIAQDTPADALRRTDRESRHQPSITDPELAPLAG
ncbi:MAG: ABC transporter ATP-binding protein [Natrialbaceae archaeon]|nr:ABC transporter ATP-binding protein [Natrialbaceae archaeon]